MENEGSNESQSVEVVEQPAQEINVETLQGLLAKEKATSERLLSESKTNAHKYRELRDSNDAKNKIELEEQENWKGLLDVEKNKSHDLQESFNKLKKSTLKKDLDFTVAKLIDRNLQDGASIDDVIHHVLETGMVEVNDDESGFLNVKDAYEKVINTKSFLFKSQKVPMSNAVPDSGAPKEKKISKEELFKQAIGILHK